MKRQKKQLPTLEEWLKFDNTNFQTKRNEFKKLLKNRKEYGFEWDWNDYLKTLHLFLTPQSYGSKIQNRLLKELNLVKIGASLDKGDFVTSQKKYGEIKASFKDSENKVHFVQIRPHQKCDFYILIAIDYTEDFSQYEVNYFILNHDEMQTCLTIFKASNCHGVTKNKKDKSQEELRFTITKDSEQWKYLVDNYKTTQTEVLSKVNNF